MSNVINLAPLFEAQKALDARIIKEKGLEGQDLLPNTILALQVEFGELANCWRGFKHWSNDQKPRTSGLRGDQPYNPLLEEYVDCLSFILSIGLQAGHAKRIIEKADVVLERGVAEEKRKSTLEQFLALNKKVAESHPYLVGNVQHYAGILATFLGLGEMLGFTLEQIEAAYYAKNRINHDRQASGY